MMDHPPAAPEPPRLSSGLPWRPILAVFIVVVVGGLFVIREFDFGSPSSAEASPGVIDSDRRPRVGEQVPDFALERVGTGDLVRLFDYRGQTVLLNFWATWCPPCRAEMPEFQELYEERLADGDFVVLAVDLQESDAQVQRFLDELGLTFPVLMDRDAEIARHFGVRGLPASLFIDRDGVLREWVFGPVFGDVLSAGVAAADAAGD